MTSAAGAVDRAADQLVATAFLERDRLAGDHRLINRTGTVDNNTIDGHLLAGTNPEPVARNDEIQRDVLFPSVFSDPSRRFRRQAKQGADGAAGLPACSQLEDLAQKDERDDHGGRLEIDGHLAVMTTKRLRE